MPRPSTAISPIHPAMAAVRSPGARCRSCASDGCGAPAALISTGPRREETIWREDQEFVTALPAPRGQ